MSLKLFSVLKIFLWIQLFLLIFRQIIDFCGIQWLMIFVNFISILITISSLFHYFLLYFLFQFFLIFYNIFIIFCYLEIISIHYLSFDLNSKSFFYNLIPNYLNPNDSELKSYVKSVECIQSSIHLILSLILIILIIIYFQNKRKKLKQQNSKTTPPLPPYTISPIIGSNAFMTTNERRESIRRSKRRRSSQRKPKLITSASYYSDSETDFYGVTQIPLNYRSIGLTNPLYCSQNETRI